MIVVVGGQCRKVGKTTAVCRIIEAVPEAKWVAVKISPHEHAPAQSGDTERYLAAGAASAHLLKPGDALPSARNLIVESNSVVEQLEPDLCFFVTDARVSEWKQSALDFISHPHLRIEAGVVSAAHLEAVRKMLALALL